MKLVFVPKMFYFSIIFSIILSIYLYIEKDKNTVVKEIDESTNNKYIKYLIYLFIISYIICIFSFRIWIYNLYFRPDMLIIFPLCIFILLYHIYTKI